MTTIRRERLKQELRDEILEAARTLFVRQGYENVSMRKIADEVGCAPGTLYLHFADKSAILGAICAETFDKLAKRMAAIRKDECEPLEALRRSGRTYMQFGVDHPHHYLLTFGRPADAEDKESPEARAGLACFDNLRKSVGRAADARLLRSDDVDCVAQTLWAASHGVVMLLITKTGFPFIEQTRFIESALDMMLDGIRAHPA